MTTLSTPGPTLGVVGGGQLGRMLAEAAAPLGVDVIVLDPTPDCPAAPPAGDQIVAEFDDVDAIRELAERADVLTFEIELADQAALERIERDTGVPCHPKPSTLDLIHDKLVQKRALDDAGIPVPAFREVESPDEVADALDDLGSPAMLKARTGGYDGRGNVPVDRDTDHAAALAEVGGEGNAMVESLVEYERELSVIAVKGDGETAAFPVGENVHREQILRETVVPARTTDAVRERARDVAEDVLDVMDGRGVYGIELFEHADGSISVNEIAPRPHNSGHWTIEGAHSSQFAQHARAVLGWPLAATDLRCPTAMANLLGDGERSRDASIENVDDVLAAPGAHLHWYGKRETRPLRKMGHVTCVQTDDESGEDLLSTARALRDGVDFA
ncbi:5-(carboxyamino)imidazole ribonucleotide synthase [Halorubellus sp. JP-L1]|uniref:5-(carboxyamino)imidazole ribonucleotide synthase n=1 Tax=Halorubellus sp. JP-L1 TaxID=2715753 RepID=UPI00140BC3CE|nr:5-(carboxyamino)imidazole ribonucleotide synthase [Halorubellus sp. JP-L1]NHN40124.1 5-(carboxyamino)imidazole ribonucleotide synthase [Halorubellus sp. JP-L1]